jgi:dienelactone hydrolase
LGASRGLGGASGSRRRAAPRAGWLLLWLGLSGCAGMAQEAGPLGAGAEVTVEAGSVASATGCRLDYDLYRPAQRRYQGLVVVAHGFLRSKARMADLSRALAAAGMIAAAVDFCNARPWDGAHWRNGLDLWRVGRSLSDGPVLYVGFSAGVLAALVAARHDRHAVAVIALDPVEHQDLGAHMAGWLDLPLLGLTGDASPCNAGGSGRRLLAAGRQVRVEQVEGAGHCDFESPSDGLCEALCGQPPGGHPTLRRQILERTVRAAAELLGR